MSFWQDHMPAGMYLRSNWAASHISDPHGRLTLDHFKADCGIEFKYPIPLENFIEYGKWYQKKALPELRQCQVNLVEPGSRGFILTLDSGERLSCRRVVIATGIAHFPWIPKELEGHPKSHVTHSSEHSGFSRFNGQNTLVVGGGQSALDAARLLKSSGAQVAVVAKQEEIRWVGQHAWLHHLGMVSWCLYSNYDVGPAGISRLVGFPNLFRWLPRQLQDPISRRATRPAGTGWQKPQLAQVPITVNCRVQSSQINNNKVHLGLSDGSQRVVDHVIIATGYRVDINRYNFMTPPIKASLRTVGGYPVLGKAFESSVPGLHFVGKPAAWTFGPLLNFVSGTHFAGAEFSRGISRGPSVCREEKKTINDIV
jgi:hypothetical protein